MKHNPSFDGLRALAALSVVIFHCSRDVLPGGFVGVDLFFVLSGFLISTILLEEHYRTGTIAFGLFYVRRALRLWPALVFMLTAYLIAAPLLFPQANAARDALLAGLYLSDYSQSFWRLPYIPLLHTWSLSVEEHFYLLWPVAVLLLARADRRVAAAMLAGAFVLASMWRMMDLAIWRDFAVTFYRFDTRMSGLILGSLFAFVPWRPKSASVNTALAVSGMAILGWAMLSLNFGAALSLLVPGVLVDLAAGCIVLALTSGDTLLGKVLAIRPLTYLGSISYSVYLWHYPIIIALRPEPSIANPLPVQAALLAVGTSILVAALSYELIEKPTKTLRSRFA